MITMTPTNPTSSPWPYRIASALAALSLVACAAPKRLYEWGDYQGKVYQHFKGQGSPDQQLLDMQQGLETMAAKSLTPPPGYHGHMALLYLTVGKPDLAAQSLIREKSLYPESGQYMDFLLNNMKKQGT